MEFEFQVEKWLGSHGLLILDNEQYEQKAFSLLL